MILVATVGANRIRPVSYLPYLSSIGAINSANVFFLFLCKIGCFADDFSCVEAANVQFLTILWRYSSCNLTYLWRWSECDLTYLWR